MTSSYDLFVSYSRKDQIRVYPLVVALQARGWSVFWDRNIPPGDIWRKHISMALRKARCIVVVWSENSIKSPWVCSEAKYGESRKKLVPVLISNVRPPVASDDIHAADLSSWMPEIGSDQFSLLVQTIGQKVGRKHKVSTKYLSYVVAGAVSAMLVLSMSISNNTTLTSRLMNVASQLDVSKKIMDSHDNNSQSPIAINSSAKLTLNKDSIGKDSTDNEKLICQLQKLMGEIGFPIGAPNGLMKGATKQITDVWLRDLNKKHDNEGYIVLIEEMESIKNGPKPTFNSNGEIIGAFIKPMPHPDQFDYTYETVDPYLPGISPADRLKDRPCLSLYVDER